jgi:hypothetical protein
MYTLIFKNYATSRAHLTTYSNIAEALKHFTDKCDAHGLEYRPDNRGNFYGSSTASEVEVELISEF